MERFIPLRWKMIAGITILLLLLFGVSLALSWHHLVAQQSAHTAERLTSQVEHFQQLLVQRADRLSVELEALSLAEEDERSGPDINQVRALLDRRWQHLAVLLDLQSAVLVRSDGIIQSQWGTALDVLPPGWAQRLLREKKPYQRNRCRPDCLQYVGIPLLLADGDHAALLVAAPLTDILVSLRNFQHADVALLTHDRTQRPWQVSVSSLSRPELNDAVLPLLAEHFTLQQLLNQPRQIHLPDRTLRVSLLEVDDEPDPEEGFVLLLMDETAQQKAIAEFWWRWGIGSALAVVVAFLLAHLFATWVTRHLRNLAAALPLLANQQFTAARQLLSGQRGRGWQDELTQLEDATWGLIAQLDLLAAEVTARTSALERLALYDPLTGLANRHRVLEVVTAALHEMRHQPRPLLLVLVDLDHFKRINDTLGYDAGDELLCTLARRLEQLQPDPELVARFGGDELLLVFRQELKDSENLLRNLMITVRQPVNTGRQVLVMQASVGVVEAAADDSADELLRHAEAAMFEAKQQGRGRWCVYHPDMLTALSDDLTLEQELSRAVRDSEFVLFVQPQISLVTRTLIGFEILLRWRHPVRGLVYPDAFITQLEQSDQIVPVGYWIIDQALKLLSRLENTGYPGLRMAVNLCSRQFADAALADLIGERLSYYRLKGGQLELELTENTLIGDFDQVMSRIQALRALGIRLAIDDFGSGYSSLNYLRRLPVDMLKIDRGFIMEMHHHDRDRQLVKTILDLAHNLELEVIAEGIERLEHLEFLASHGCPFGQGYLFSRPFDSADLLAVLSQQIVGGRWRL